MCLCLKYTRGTNIQCAHSTYKTHQPLSVQPCTAHQYTQYVQDTPVCQSTPIQHTNPHSMHKTHQPLSVHPCTAHQYTSTYKTHQPLSAHPYTAHQYKHVKTHQPLSVHPCTAHQYSTPRLILHNVSYNISSVK